MAEIRHKAWCLGLGRTGTGSFCEALTILGYKNVRHNPVFEELASLDGAADNGCILFYKYLDFRHPGSKFIYLHRDLESWLASIEYISNRHPLEASEGKWHDIVIQRRMAIYETVRFERDKFIAAWHRHEADVKRYFRGRPGDLLEMSITDGEGWEKLCPFLELPVPEVPFPHRQKRHSNDYYVSPPLEMEKRDSEVRAEV